MCRHTLYNRTYNCIVVGIQSDHRTLEKADTIPNFTVKKLKTFNKLGDPDYKNDNSGFKIPAQKYRNKALLVPNLGILFLQEILQLGKFEGTYFKYANIIFKFQPQNNQIRHFRS